MVGFATVAAVRRPPSLARRAVSALLVLLLSSVPVAIRAQELGDRVRVAGRVVDRATGAPVADALVEIDGSWQYAYTDSTGAFALDAVEQGMREFRVTRLGYAGATATHDVQPAAMLRLELDSRPLVMEGVALQARRLDRRLRDAPYEVQVFRRAELIRSDSRTAFSFLHRAAGLQFIACGAADEALCLLWRGSRIAPSIVVDDAATAGGAERLDRYDLRHVYRIEVIRRGAIIRVYTTGFAEDLAVGRAWITPTVAW